MNVAYAQTYGLPLQFQKRQGDTFLDQVRLIGVRDKQYRLVVISHKTGLGTIYDSPSGASSEYRTRIESWRASSLHSSSSSLHSSSSSLHSSSSSLQSFSSTSSSLFNDVDDDDDDEYMTLSVADDSLTEDQASQKENGEKVKRKLPASGGWLALHYLGKNGRLYSLDNLFVRVELPSKFKRKTFERIWNQNQVGSEYEPMYWSMADPPYMAAAFETGANFIKMTTMDLSTTFNTTFNTTSSVSNQGDTQLLQAIENMATA